MTPFHSLVHGVLRNTAWATPKHVAQAMCGDLTDVEFALLDLCGMGAASLVAPELHLFQAITKTCETGSRTTRPRRRLGLLRRRPAGKKQKKRRPPPKQTAQQTDTVR
jgi:hypothetical protein